MEQSKVSIVTDSASDIPEHIAHDLNISVVPHFVRFGTEEFLDRIQISSDTFYEKMISGLVPKTSHPNVGAFINIYQSLTKTSEGIISIHTSARMTGVVNSAKAASNSLPNMKVEIINSSQVSMATGLLVIRAAKLAAEGESFDNIIKMIQKLIPRVFLYGVADSLEYALRGGRLGKAKSLLSNLIKVKPIVRIGDGQLLPVGLARTRKKAMLDIIENIQKLGKIEEAAIIHMHAIETATELASMLKDICQEEKIIIAEAGPAIGTHAGPGSFGVACIMSDPYDR